MPGTSGMSNESMKAWVRAYVEDALSSSASGGGVLVHTL